MYQLFVDFIFYKIKKFIILRRFHWYLNSYICRIIFFLIIIKELIPLRLYLLKYIYCILYHDIILKKSRNLYELQIAINLQSTIYQYTSN